MLTCVRAMSHAQFSHATVAAAPAYLTRRRCPTLRLYAAAEENTARSIEQATHVSSDPNHRDHLLFPLNIRLPGANPGVCRPPPLLGPSTTLRVQSYEARKQNATASTWMAWTHGMGNSTPARLAGTHPSTRVPFVLPRSVNVTRPSEFSNFPWVVETSSSLGKLIPFCLNCDFGGEES